MTGMIAMVAMVTMAMGITVITIMEIVEEDNKEHCCTSTHMTQNSKYSSCL